MCALTMGKCRSATNVSKTDCATVWLDLQIPRSDYMPKRGQGSTMQPGGCVPIFVVLIELAEELPESRLIGVRSGSVHNCSQALSRQQFAPSRETSSAVMGSR